MPRVSLVPFDKVDPELQKVMSAYDEELGGSEFVRVYAHAPETFKRFIAFYFPLITETRGTIDMRITELARLKVAEKNGCAL
jgi:hypothetical protein